MATQELVQGLQQMEQRQQEMIQSMQQQSDTLTATILQADRAESSLRDSAIVIDGLRSAVSAVTAETEQAVQRGVDLLNAGNEHPGGELF